MHADLFILSLLASVTLGLIWAWLQARGSRGPTCSSACTSSPPRCCSPGCRGRSSRTCSSSPRRRSRNESPTRTARQEQPADAPATIPRTGGRARHSAKHRATTRRTESKLMPTFVYMTRCDGCGHCVDICPSDIMHIDKTYRRAYNIEPSMCWECYSCVKACPQNAIDMRGYADFAPLGHSVRVLARRKERHDRVEDQVPQRHGKELPVADHHQALGIDHPQARGCSRAQQGNARRPAARATSRMAPHG